MVLQPATAPMVLGLLGLVAAWARRWPRLSALAGAAAGGLTWACAVGVPGAPGSSPIVVPLTTCVWVVWSAHRYGSESFRQRARILTAVTGGVLVAAGLLGALAVASARSEVERGSERLQAGLAAARVGDTEVAVADFRAAQRALSASESTLGAVWARPPGSSLG